MHKRTLQRLFPTAKFNEPLKRYTAWKIGGPADVLLEPPGARELIEAAETAREHDVPVTILGGGTNVLILDGGIRPPDAVSPASSSPAAYRGRSGGRCI